MSEALPCLVCGKIPRVYREVSMKKDVPGDLRAKHECNTRPDDGTRVCFDINLDKWNERQIAEMNSDYEMLENAKMHLERSHYEMTHPKNKKSQ